MDTDPQALASCVVTNIKAGCKLLTSLCVLPGGAVLSHAVPLFVCAVFSAHMREKALEALLWFTQLPAPRDRPPILTPSEMVQWMSTGVCGVCWSCRCSWSCRFLCRLYMFSRLASVTEAVDTSAMPVHKCADVSCSACLNRPGGSVNGFRVEVIAAVVTAAGHAVQHSAADEHLRWLHDTAPALHLLPVLLLCRWRHCLASSTCHICRPLA